MTCFVLLGLPLPYPFDILSQADMLVGYELRDERVRICIEVPKELGVRLNDRSPRAAPALRPEAAYELLQHRNAVRGPVKNMERQVGPLKGGLLFSSVENLTTAAMVG